MRKPVVARAGRIAEETIGVIAGLSAVAGIACLIIGVAYLAYTAIF